MFPYIYMGFPLPPIVGFPFLHGFSVLMWGPPRCWPPSRPGRMTTSAASARPSPSSTVGLFGGSAMEKHGGHIGISSATMVIYWYTGDMNGYDMNDMCIYVYIYIWVEYMNGINGDVNGIWVGYFHGSGPGKQGKPVGKLFWNRGWNPHLVLILQEGWDLIKTKKGLSNKILMLNMVQWSQCKMDLMYIINVSKEMDLASKVFSMYIVSIYVYVCVYIYM